MRKSTDFARGARGAHAPKKPKLGKDTKDAVLQAFRPHIFFDDQLKNVTGVVPSGHVLFGIKNQPSPPTVPTTAPVPSVTAERVISPRAEPQVELVAAAAAAMEEVTKLTKKEFDVQCRAIFRSYTPLARHSPVLDERFRVFLAKHSQRTTEERGKIVTVLKKYDLSDLHGHDPILNRELGDIVLSKLEKAVDEALAPKQQDLNL